jgi:hypothetical protein
MTLSVTAFNIKTLSIIMLLHYAECCVLLIIMLNVVMLNVVTLNVIMLSECRSAHKISSVNKPLVNALYVCVCVCVCLSVCPNCMGAYKDKLNNIFSIQTGHHELTVFSKQFFVCNASRDWFITRRLDAHRESLGERTCQKDFTT